MKNVLILFLFVLLLIGCEQKKDDFITLEFWTLQLSPVFDNYFKEVIEKYENENPGIKIKWVDIPYDAAIQKLLASMAAGNPPDIVNLSADFLSKFTSMNALVDFNTLIENQELDKYLSGALKDCTHNGNIAGLPWYLNTYVLIYNNKFISDAGFTENDIPKTFSELTSFIKKYKDKTGNFALFWNIGKDSYLPMMLGSEGVPMTNDEMTEAVFNKNQSVQLIDEWVNLYKNGYLQSESIIKTGTSIIEPYQSGQVAMVFTGPVFLQRIRDNAPSIYEQTDIAPAVVGSTGKHELATMAVSVTAKSKYKKEAADFVLYITNAKNQFKFCQIVTAYPSVKEALNNKFFRELDGTLETKARVIGASELFEAERLRNYLLHPKFDQLRDAFDEAIQNACLGKLSTQKALDKAAATWNVILREN